MDPDNEDKPLKDYGSFSHQPVGDDEIQSHHTERWQHQAMYVGLHFPQQSHSGGKKRHHRKHRRDREKSSSRTSREADKPVTPPRQRVHFLLGQDDDTCETHDIFCEMEELRNEDGELEWRETARWIKFEEDVEEGGERWSKPHVATLALHSLFELRKGIMTGTVMLDVDAIDLYNITELVLEHLVGSKQLSASKREQVQDCLLSRHRHQHEKKKGLPMVRSLADIGRKNSEKKLEKDSSLGVPRRGSTKDLEEGNLSEAPSTHKFNEHFAKKVPPGAEASNILVGEVDFLSEPVMAFVRLQKAVLLADLTEVPVPTRFLFILLGPVGNQQKYHEIGRSIATLMSDEVFHDVAYKAKNREDLLAGIDEFLDQVTVLPPGEWDPSIRIEPPKSVPSQEGRKVNPNLPNGGMHHEEEEENHGDPTLMRTGRIFGGLRDDIKRKLPFYVGDFKDGIHVQCVASFFFMYFACLTPIITFGGLLGTATGNNIAAMESLVSGAICGVTYHLFSGQPLTIIGSTGPVLVFETIVYNFSKDNGLDYLALRFWIGMWMALALFFVVMFDLSALVRYITRFTEESFAVLIAVIFIVEAFKKLFHIGDKYPVDLHPNAEKDYTCFCLPANDTHSHDHMYTTDATISMTTMGSQNTTYLDWSAMDKEQCTENAGVLAGTGCSTPHYYPDVFFFSCLLFIFTFVLSMALKTFRNTRYLSNKVRIMISDFAVFTAITIMVLTDALIGLKTPKLQVPEEFRPTLETRGWVVNPFANAVWTIPAAILPAILATILIFMDQQITAVIVNRKENKLKKGSGYHLDLLLICIQIVICSTLGTPWFVAATVLSINHVRSLTRESETAAPGERPKFLGVREQRLTGTVVFIMVGLSALMAKVLKFIPMPVLYGVFLFMGISSVKGLQLVQRLSIIFMPAKYQPDYMFLRHVPLRRVHFFTVIQVICLAILWVIKTIKSVSIIFPLMVLAMCFVRKALDWVFTRHELKWLDDIMPESHKREKADKNKKGHVEVVEPIEPEPQVSIPTKDGKTISIPVSRIKFDPITKQLTYAEHPSSSDLLKQMTQDTQPQVDDRSLKNRTPNNIEEEKTNPVKFTIDDEEADSLSPLQIVIDPPNDKTSKV